MVTLHRVFNGLGQARPDFRPVAVADGFNHQLAQGAAREVQPAQHIKHLPAEGLPRLLELFQQPPVHVPLTGFGGNQVPQVADLGLADAVDAAKALLEAVGVPGQVVVHHQVRALQVDALAGGVGRQEHPHLGVVQKALLGLAPFLTSHAAVNDHHRFRVPEAVADAALQVAQRIPVFGKHHQLLAWRGHRRRNVFPGFRGQLAGRAG